MSLFSVLNQVFFSDTYLKMEGGAVKRDFNMKNPLVLFKERLPMNFSGLSIS